MNCQLIGPSRVLQFDQPLADEALHRFTGIGQDLAVGAESRGLDREHEAVRRLIAPLGPARGLELE